MNKIHIEHEICLQAARINIFFIVILWVSINPYNVAIKRHMAYGFVGYLPSVMSSCRYSLQPFTIKSHWPSGISRPLFIHATVGRALCREFTSFGWSVFTILSQHTASFSIYFISPSFAKQHLSPVQLKRDPSLWCVSCRIHRVPILPSLPLSLLPSHITCNLLTSINKNYFDWSPHNTICHYKIHWHYFLDEIPLYFYLFL